MPTVPIYKQQTQLNAAPSVGQQAVRSPLTQAGNALTNVSDGLSQIAEQAQDRRNADQVFNAEAALNEQYLAFESEQRQRLGEDAYGVTNDTDEWFKKTGEAQRKALENDTQRALYDRTLERVKSSGTRAAYRFEEGERKVATQNAINSAVTNEINAAAAHYDDPDAIAASKEAIQNRVRVAAGYGGWPPEQLKAELEAKTTQLHARVIQAMVEDDPSGARDYYKENKNEIAGTARDGIKKLLESGSRREAAQQHTDSIMAKGLTEEEALSEARKISDPEERDDATARIKVRYAEQKKVADEQEKELADQAWDIFARTGRVESIPTALLDQLDGRTLQALKNQEAGGTSTTDWDYYYQMVQDARDNPQVFADRDLRQDFPHLGTAQRGTMVKIQEDLRDPNNLPDAGTFAQQISTSVKLLDIKKPEDKGQFEFAARNAVDAFIQREGRKPTYDERQKLIDRLMIEGEIPGFIFNSSRRLYEVVGTEDEADFVPEVPDVDRTKIEEALSRQGIAATDEIVMQVYRAAKGL